MKTKEREQPVTMKPQSQVAPAWLMATDARTGNRRELQKVEGTVKSSSKP